MSHEFLHDARALARVWLERHLLLYAARYQRADPTTADLYVDRAEVDAFLAGRLGGGDGRDEALAALDAREARLRDAVHADMARAAEAGRPVPSEDLRAAFDVRDERVMDVVLALWTWELDADFARAATHAWCDFTRKEPDIGFVVELVARDADERDREPSRHGTHASPLPCRHRPSAPCSTARGMRAPRPSACSVTPQPKVSAPNRAAPSRAAASTCSRRRSAR